MKADDSITMIEPVIDHSLSLLAGRAATGDVAHGILAAMRRVRQALDEIGGYTLVAMLDETIRDRLIIRRLREHRAGTVSPFGRLPRIGPMADMAETVMVAAADACLVYAADVPDSTGMMSVLLILVDRLIETLGDAPEHRELARWLAGPEETPATETGEAVFAVSVH